VSLRVLVPLWQKFEHLQNRKPIENRYWGVYTLFFWKFLADKNYEEEGFI
jgi:hypothetical protein